MGCCIGASYQLCYFIEFVVCLILWRVTLSGYIALLAQKCAQGFLTAENLNVTSAICVRSSPSSVHWIFLLEGCIFFYFCNFLTMDLMFSMNRQARDVIKAIKKRLKNSNPNTQLFAVLVSANFLFYLFTNTCNCTFARFEKEEQEWLISLKNTGFLCSPFSTMHKRWLG